MARESLTSPPAGTPPIEWLRLGNVPLSRVTFERAVELIAAWAGRPPFRLIVTPNVDHVIHYQKNEDFRRAYERAALSLADGRPVLWAARYLGLPPLEKVSGSDLLPALCRRGMAERWRMFFIGGRSEAELTLCLERIAARHPGVTVGGHCPPLGFERDPAQSARLVAAIRGFKPDLVLMGVGTPKSEIWLERQMAALGCGVGLSIGAGLRFLAGLDRRAPRWMQAVGLEWFWRMLSEPRRLWRRYLVDDMQFFPLVWRWKRTRP